MKIKIGIIGCKRGQKIIEILKKTVLDTEVVAAYDVNKKILKKFSKNNKKIKIFNKEKSFFKFRNMN